MAPRARPDTRRITSPSLAPLVPRVRPVPRGQPELRVTPVPLVPRVRRGLLVRPGSVRAKLTDRNFLELVQASVYGDPVRASGGRERTLELVLDELS